MGLDITAYTKVKLIETLEDIEEWETKYWMADNDTQTDYIYSGYFKDGNYHKEWAEGLEPGGVYKYEDCHSFRAGSYSGYNRWREWLSMLGLGVMPETVWKNAKLYENKPFYRLINFSDCEGIISSKFSKELAKHFADHQSIVDASDSDEYYKEKYTDWRKAFELAADNGYVSFH